MSSISLILALAVSLVIVLRVGMGIRIDGWPALIIGALGIAYCYLATPSLNLLLVYAVSLVFVLYGAVALAVRLCRSIFRNHT